MRAIGIVGADGTGKTTLISGLVERLGGNYVVCGGVARNVIKQGFPLGKSANKESYIELIRHQISSVTPHLGTNNLLVDRTLIDPYCYAMVNRDLPRPYIDDRFIEFLRTIWILETKYIEAYFLTSADFPQKSDGVREFDLEYQSRIDQFLEQTLTENQIPFLRLRGGIDERLNKALEFLSPGGT
ncbi:AAA family ATPase [Allorhizobium pseudoryzae]|uniref:AAA family ATPase n=1 Tax=Allorhizobium pseudoryzae TaxID=379684 RepID=UPI003D04741C